MTLRGVERFWSRVNKTDDCWLWMGSTLAFGHGHLGRLVNGEKIDYLAHRFAYEATYGPVPDGLCVLHRCDVPACVRPDHLFLGSRADNNQDCADKRRKPAGEGHYNAKLTAEKVRQIRDLYARGLTQNELADRFGIKQMQVSRIVRREAWKHVD